MRGQALWTNQSQALRAPGVHGARGTGSKPCLSPPAVTTQSHVSLSLSLSVNCRPEVPHQSQWAAAVEIAEVESLLLRLPPEVSRFIT